MDTCPYVLVIVRVGKNGDVDTDKEDLDQSYAPGGSNIKGVSISQKGDIEFGGVTDFDQIPEIRIVFQTLAKSINWGGSTYELAFNDPDYLKSATDALWIAERHEVGQDPGHKPSGPGNGGGVFNSISYPTSDPSCKVPDQMTDRASVQATLYPARLPEGSHHNYALATSLVYPGKTFVARADPQIKNTGNEGRNQPGFSLVELLLAILVAALFGGLLGRWLLSRRNGAA